MSKEKQIEEMWNIMTTDCNEECVGCEFENDNWCFTHRVINNLYNAGYRKQSENVIELPCKPGDLVHFKGLETPWTVSAIHFYAEGLPQISITSATGKVTSTMNANEFHMFCSVLTEEEAKTKGGEE